MLPRGAAAGSPSPDALEVRNLPAGAARAALDPVVAPVQPGLDLQEDLQHRWIGLGDVFALARVAAGRRIERIEAHSIVDDWFGEGLEAAHALRFPKSVSEIVPMEPRRSDLP